ncbi:hypothetical protein L7F22_065629 [Adiantum nelumboides]|nr:hypothetical protein [Adiantum nelumboides]
MAPKKSTKGDKKSILTPPSRKNTRSYNVMPEPLSPTQMESHEIEIPHDDVQTQEIRVHEPVTESWPSFDLGITYKNVVFDGGGTCSVNTHGFQPSTIHRSFSAPTLEPVLNDEHAFVGHVECTACTVDRRSRTSSGFIEVDMDLEKEIAECGENRSKKKDDWARKRFDEYRRHVGIDDSIPIENLDLKEFATAMNRSVKAGANVRTKKSEVVPAVDEMNMLADSECLVTHPVGLQRRYCERLSKNDKVSIKHCEESDFRLPVKSYDADVVSTMRELFRCLPNFIDVLDEMRYILLQAKRNPITEQYCVLRMLPKILVCLSTYLTRRFAVSRMSLAEVLVEVGMQVIGHRRVDNYKKYDASSSLKRAAAQSILRSPLDADGNPKKFSDVYEQRVSPHDAEIEDDTLKMIEEEWHEGAKALSLGSSSSFNSMFNGAIFNNCVINVHGLAGSSRGYARARK